MARRSSTGEQLIPRYLREAFSALRQRPKDDPPGTTFALTAIEVDGQPRWAIVAVATDGRQTTYIPLFTAIHPGARVSIGGVQGEDASDRFRRAFDKLDE